MRSNTKLSDFQKGMLQGLRDIQTNVKVVSNFETTIAYLQFPNTVEFSLSVSSPDEKKFRAKVGEFYARNRLRNGETVKMSTGDFYHMLGDGVFGIYLD